MSQLSNTKLEKSKQRELAIRRAEYLKNIKIKVKLSEKIIDEERIITIQTFSMQNKKGIQLVMRRLSQLDTLITHLNLQYGGHVIPVFEYDLYYQKNFKMDQLVPDVEQFLNDLKNNKYCRQDVKFYCFLIQQNTTFLKQMGFNRIINNATDKSRRYLNDLFTRKQIPMLKDTGTLIFAHKELQTTIQNYYQFKSLSIIKIKQSSLFQQISELLVQMSAWPGIAIQPQQYDKQFVYHTIRSCQKLIVQSKQAYKRWQNLVDNVRQLQHNVYKGLHQFQQKFNYSNDQLKQWSQSLSRQFFQLCNYITQKTEVLAAEIFKINKKFLDMTVFSGQSIVIEQEEQKSIGIQRKVKQIQNNLIQQQKKQKVSLSDIPTTIPALTQNNSFKIEQQIKIDEENLHPSTKQTSSTNPQQHLKQKEESLTLPIVKRQQITCQDD